MKRATKVAAAVAAAAAAATAAAVVWSVASFWLPVDAPMLLQVQVVVRDASSGMPVGGARVAVERAGERREAITAADGTAEIGWSFDHNGESTPLGGRRGQFQLTERVAVESAGYAPVNEALADFAPGGKSFADRSPIRAILRLRRPE